MSDTSDTSVHDSPPRRKRQLVEKPKPKLIHPKSIKRSHLLSSLRILENDLKDTFPDVDPLQEKISSKERVEAFKRCCSLDLTTHHVSSWYCSNSKTRLLTYSLSNSVFRHDWSTAARCIKLMLSTERCSYFVFRTLLLVLFNHPRANAEVVDNFMRRVLNLRTRSEQLTFLRQLYLLPDDIEAYTHQGDPMSTRIEDEGMTTSEDEE